MFRIILSLMVMICFFPCFVTGEITIESGSDYITALDSTGILVHIDSAYKKNRIFSGYRAEKVYLHLVHVPGTAAAYDISALYGLTSVRMGYRASWLENDTLSDITLRVIDAEADSSAYLEIPVIEAAKVQIKFTPVSGSLGDFTIYGAIKQVRR